MVGMWCCLRWQDARKRSWQRGGASGRTGNWTDPRWNPGLWVWKEREDGQGEGEWKRPEMRALITLDRLSYEEGDLNG